MEEENLMYVSRLYVVSLESDSLVSIAMIKFCLYKAKYAKLLLYIIFCLSEIRQFSVSVIFPFLLRVYLNYYIKVSISIKKCFNLENEMHGISKIKLY